MHRLIVDFCVPNKNTVTIHLPVLDFELQCQKLQAAFP